MKRKLRVFFCSLLFIVVCMVTILGFIENVWIGLLILFLVGLFGIGLTDFMK